MSFIFEIVILILMVGIGMEIGRVATALERIATHNERLDR